MSRWLGGCCGPSDATLPQTLSASSLVLILEVLEPLVYFLLVLSTLLPSLVLLVVEADEVLASHIEAVKVIDGVLGTENVIVDHEARPLCLRRIAFAHLADRAILAKDVVELIRRDLEWQVPDEDDLVHLGWQTHIRLNLCVHFSTLIYL